jgi:RHS repeat-associated protein
MKPANRPAWLLAGAILLGVLTGRAEAQLTCGQIANATCRPVTIDGTCSVGEVEEGAASCAQQGSQTTVCCAPQDCNLRGGTCMSGIATCPAEQGSLGDGTCASGGLCCGSPPYTGQTCAQMGADFCSLTLNCPNGSTPKGAGINCTMCCASTGACNNDQTCATGEPCSCSDCSTASRCQSSGPGVSTYKVEFLHTDALGSVRMVTDQAGEVVSRRDYYPFGETINASVNGRATIEGYSDSEVSRQRFTGKERDTESGLDYFGARYYSGAQGRFTTVDPANAGARPEAPQSWNGYSYALNNPGKFVDPDGKSATLALGILGAIVGGVDAWAAGGDTRAIQKGIVAGGLGGAVAGSVIDTFGGSALVLGGSAALGAHVANETDAAIDGRTPSSAERAYVATEAGLMGGLLGKIGPGSSGPTRLSGTMDPMDIRFTQDNIGANFGKNSLGSASVEAMVGGLRAGATNADKIPALRVVEMNGKLYSLDNRRLEAFRRAGVAVRFEVVSLADVQKEFAKKFTTNNDGASASTRGQPK